MQIACIYKITNIINNKIYIGYTSQKLQKRLYQHKWEAENRCSTYLHKAIVHYGKEVFKMESIYELKETDDWQEKEKYFIKLYQSNNSKFGYNLTNGGENPPVHYGDDNIGATLSEEDYQKIVQLLQASTHTLVDISKMFNVDDGTIERINNGLIRYNAKIKYPIRSLSFNKQRASNIIHDLLHTNLKIKDIAQKYKMHYQNISDINRGKTYSWLHSYELPLRKNTRVYNK